MDQVEKLCDSICLINRGRAGATGGLLKSKRVTGAQFIQIQYEGDGGFFARCALVESSNNYGNYAEVKSAAAWIRRMLLRAAIAGREGVPLRSDGTLAGTNLYRSGEKADASGGLRNTWIICKHECFKRIRTRSFLITAS